MLYLHIKKCYTKKEKKKYVFSKLCTIMKESSDHTCTNCPPCGTEAVGGWSLMYKLSLKIEECGSSLKRKLHQLSSPY